MSTINVKVMPVKISPHTNADKLEIATVGGEGGFTAIVAKDEFKDGDLAIFLPPDSVLPDKMIEWFKANKKIELRGGRIRHTKIRGAFSDGLCLVPSQWLKPENIIEDNDVTELLGITKYIPPPPPMDWSLYRAGKGISMHYENENFKLYTDIENFKKYPKILQPGEEVVATKKMHGTNFRAGWVEKPAWKKEKLIEKIKLLFGFSKEFLVGSHNKTRYVTDKNTAGGDLYWRAALKYNLSGIAKKISKDYWSNANVIIYAEIIGPKIQTGYDYGIPRGNIEIRVFDIMVNGQYIGWELLESICAKYNLPTVEQVYRGPWNLDVVNLAQVIDQYGDCKYNREGIVVKPVQERADPKCGRVIFKCISPAYLLDKKNSEWH